MMLQRKVAFIVTYIGADAYSVLRKLFSPEDPCKKKLIKNLSTLLRNILNHVLMRLPNHINLIKLNKGLNQ